MRLLRVGSYGLFGHHVSSAPWNNHGPHYQWLTPLIGGVSTRGKNPPDWILGGAESPPTSLQLAIGWGSSSLCLQQQVHAPRGGGEVGPIL